MEFIFFNSLTTKGPIIEKPVHCFAEQLSGLVSMIGASVMKELKT